jgi:membrane protease YdiL (CAAX protease family)
MVVAMARDAVRQERRFAVTPSTLQSPVSSVPAPTLAPKVQGQHVAAWVLGTAWAVFAALALLLIPILDRFAIDARLYGLLVPLGALALALATAPYARAHGVPLTWGRYAIDGVDLAAIALLYIPIVALFYLAMVVLGPDRPMPLFFAYAAGMVVGGAGPVVYTVWFRHRSLDDLGIGKRHWRETVALGLALAAVQSGMMFWGYTFPAPATWAPLLALSLAVGLFEAIFFRGFVQARLEASFGLVPGVLLAAALYAAYHVGYGMNLGEMAFLLGLGVTYAVAFRITGNLLAIWPLLIPLGSFFNRLQADDMAALPWAAILGFADVIGVIAAVIWFAHTRERRMAAASTPPAAVAAHGA